MRARVRPLTFPKSEHTARTNEDALAYSAAAGLFAVADGVGSASFSGEWARALVSHFVAAPLLTDDPFELEWWLRRAQCLYDDRVPRPESLPPFAQEKARHGGASTLVTLRLSAVGPTTARAEVLACGDSCAILRRAGAAVVESFPLREAAQFSTSTVALPARARYFDRSFHRGRRWALTLRRGDVVILATDAIARAVLAGEADGGGAFASVAAATADGWSDLVRGWRESGTLVDDDATALVVALGDDGVELGRTVGPAPGLVAEREAELAAALAEGRRESIAVAYGDGSYFPANRLGAIEAQQARLVADAVTAVRAGVMRYLAARCDDPLSLAALWERWAPLLEQEPSAATLRHSLTQLSVPLAPPTWPHVAAFREAVARGDGEGAAALAPPDSLSYLLTDGERELARVRPKTRKPAHQEPDKLARQEPDKLAHQEPGKATRPRPRRAPPPGDGSG